MLDQSTRLAFPALFADGHWGSRQMRDEVTLFVEAAEVVVRLDASGEELVVALSELSGAAWRASVLSLHRDDKVLRLSGGASLDRAWHAVSHRACALPEVARGLRSIGGRRSGHEDAHVRFITPLLQARRRLVGDEPIDWRVANFDSAALDERVRGVVASMALERHASRPPHRRALEAALLEACESMLVQLSVVSSAGAALHAAADERRFEQWRRWAHELRVLFVQADRSWSRIAEVLDLESRSDVILRER